MARLARFRPDLLAAGGTLHDQRKAINQRDFEHRSLKAIAWTIMFLFCAGWWALILHLAGLL